MSEKKRKRNSIQGKIKNNQLEISLNPKIYPLEAVYGACYVFIDRAYLFLDGDPKREIKVFIKGKEKNSSKELKRLKGEFENELLNYAFRISLAKYTKEIRDMIVERALFSALPHKEETQKEDVFEEDPLGIAVPWEEKYGEKNKSKKAK